MDDDDEEVTSIEMLRDYECPECGPMTDVIEDYLITEDQALVALGGDDAGVIRCPTDWCDEELELTLDASLDLLKMVAERMPDAAPSCSMRGHWFQWCT